MSIQFIVGGSGTGKTTYMYEQMIHQSMQPNHNPILYILPEQSNLSAEQEMVQRHPQGGTMDISILSFTRLSFMVFDELGIKTNAILDEYGKSMLIRKVLSSINEQLVFYKNCTGKPGFIEEMKSILSEFYQYQMQGDTMEKVMNLLDRNSGLYYKMKDLQLIMNTFEEALMDNYMVAEQVLGMLRDVAGESHILKNASVYMDGFSGFTPIQYSVIEEFLKLGCDLYIAFSVESSVIGNNNYGEQELFSVCKREYEKLCYMASKHQVTVFPHVALQKNYRLQNAPAIHHLEQHIFRIPAVIYEEDVQDIHGVAAPDVESEIAFVTNKIKSYVVDKGYRYRDFAVLTSDMTGISHYMKHYMEQMEIPCFFDYNEPLAHNPMSEVVWLLFEMYRTDFSYKSVFSFLKTGFFDIPMEDIYELENYVIKYGIRGYKQWNQPFRGGIKGLGKINHTRSVFMEELSDLSPVFLKKEGLGRDYIESLYSFVMEHHLAEKLHIQSEDFENKGMLKEADIYRQIYGKWIEVLDKTVDIIGDEKIERDILSKMLTTGIESLQLGAIPSTLDQVVVGDFERTRLHDIKVLFIVGMNDGLLPKLKNEAGILLDKDRKIFQSLEINLAPDFMQDIFMQQYYFYLQITQASNELYFCYHRSDAKGNEQKPSYYMNQILSIFPKLNIIDSGEFHNRIAFTKDQIIADFSDLIMRDALKDSSIYHIMDKHFNADLQHILNGYLYDNNPGCLNKKMVQALYGHNMIYSVSKLESFSRCAFAFFLQYGLKIKKREEYKVESNNIGTILHEVMELFFSDLKNNGINIKELNQEQRDAMVEKLTIESAKRENETIFESDYRKKHQLEVLIRIAKRSIENLCRHMEKGNMEPAYFEKEFSPADRLKYIQIALEDDMQMELKGVVDRVDIKEMKDTVYFKIIDYKSGAKDIDFVSVYEGKQLQLAVYMSVMKELLERQYPGKEVIPTGMYYYQLQDKIVDEWEDNLIEKARMENSKLTGLANKDETCRNLMDGMTGEVSPVKYKQNGDLAAQNKSLVSSEELQQISAFVRNKMMDIGNEIIHGQMDMNPEKGEYACPCQYCDYTSICRFEPGLGGNHYRIHTKIDEKCAKEQIMNFGKEVDSDAMDK